MGKVSVLESVTLDGVMQAPSGPDEDTSGSFTRGGWAPPYADPVIGQRMAEGMAQQPALLFGRRTYEQFFSYWPHQVDNPYTPVLDAARKYVVSSTPGLELPWQNSTLLDGVEAVAKLKEAEPSDLLILGSGELVRSLTRAGLVDEYLLLVHPIVLGQGRRLFDDGIEATLELVDATPSTTGVIMATYRPEAAR
jgi:dihydrofolate reductase